MMGVIPILVKFSCFFDRINIISRIATSEQWIIKCKLYSIQDMRRYQR
jgi:hypothetical protein